MTEIRGHGLGAGNDPGRLTVGDVDAADWKEPQAAEGWQKAARAAPRASYNPGMQRLFRLRVSGGARISGIVVFILLSCLLLAGKDFVMPKAQPAKTYPARDDHPTEKVAVAVDPYDMADKADIFSTRYKDYGYLPVFFVITNDGDQPVSLTGMKPELITVNRTKLYAATSDDLMRRMAHPSHSDVPSPLPLPKKVKGGVSSKTREEIDAALFAARAVEPHTTVSGFLFFDVSGMSTPLAGANFYLTGVKDAGGTELMYFEIPMEKYLSAPQKRSD